MAAGEFPKPVHISERSVGWLAGEVDAWLDQRRAERDAKAS
jgi:prophage regulatory protein